MSSESGFVPVAALSRRDAVRGIAAALVAAGCGEGLPRAAAAQVHDQVETERTLQGEYKARYFNEHEFKTLERLSELIVPADEHGPSGRAGGAPEFIDLLASQNGELANIFTGGILWLDDASQERHAQRFVGCAPDAQLAILDALVEADRAAAQGDERWPSRDYARFSIFGVARPGEMRRGLDFFNWARRLVVDAYYTSPAGIEELGFVGNSSHTEYSVPQAAIDHVVARGPFDEV